MPCLSDQTQLASLFAGCTIDSLKSGMIGQLSVMCTDVNNVPITNLNDGTDGELITWDATGAPTTIPVGTAGQVLTTNGAGAVPTWEDGSSIITYDEYTANEVSDYSTSSTSFVNIGGGMSLSITTTGNPVWIGFSGSVSPSGGGIRLYFDVDIDSGTPMNGDDGTIVHEIDAARPHTVGFVRMITGLSAGVHTFDLQWKLTGGSMTLFAGAGTAFGDVHPQFWATEIV